MKTDSPNSPYVGLVPYLERDAERFCGRTIETETLVSLTLGSRCLVVHGPSGVGKSSLLRAGVSAALQKIASAQKEAYGKPDFVVAYCSDWKESSPLQTVTAAIASAWEMDAARSNPNLRDMVANGVTKRSTDLVLILDQFEEFFLYHPNAVYSPGSAAGGWLSQIAALMGANPGQGGRVTTLPVHLIIALREEALAKLDGLQRLVPILFDNVYRVAPLTTHQAREAVVEPLEWWNSTHGDQPPVSATPVFADQVVEQVRLGKVAFDQLSKARQSTTAISEDLDAVEAPFLQLVLETVWHESMKRWSENPSLKRELDVAILDELGGAPAIVNNHLKRTLEQTKDKDGRNLFKGDELELIARLSLHLVTVDLAKIAHSAASLAEFVERPVGEVEEILTNLERLRILRRIPIPGKPGQDRYEIAHDMLGKAIVNWRPNYLKNVEISRLRGRTKQRILKWSFAAAAVVLLILAVLLVNSRRGWNEAKGKTIDVENALQAVKVAKKFAEDQRDDAVKEAGYARTLAENLDIKANQEAESRKNQKMELQKMETVIASFVKKHPEYEGELNAATDQIKQAVDQLKDPRVASLQSAGPITVARYSPDGRYIAVGSENKKLYLWSRTGGPPINQTTASDSVGGVKSLAFSPSEGFLLTGSAGSSIRLFDPRRQKLGAGLEVATQNSVNFIGFSNNGLFSVSLDDDRLAMLRDWGTYPKLLPTKPAKIWRHSGAVTFADFSNDGTRVVTSCEDGKVRVFLTSGNTDLLNVTVSGSSNNPLDVQAPTRKFRFSPTNPDLVVGGAGYSKLVWFYLSGNRKALYQDHTKSEQERGAFVHAKLGAVWDVAFQPKGKYLVSVGTDGQCLIWDTATAKTIASIPTEIGGRLFDVEWGSNGLLALGGEDGWIELWDLGIPLEPKKVFATQAHRSPVWSIQFDPQGEQVLTYGRDIRTLAKPILKASDKAADWTAPANYPSNDFTAAIWSIEAAKRKGWSAHSHQK